MHLKFQALRKSLHRNKRLELPEQHVCQRIDEPTSMMWSLKGRPYNTTIANGALVFLTIFTGAIFYLPLFFSSEVGVFEYLMGSATYAIVLWAIIGTTHQKTNFCYRLTSSGIELCEWKELSKGLLLFAKWLAIVFAIISVFMIALGPMAFLLALGGAGGIGLMSLYMINSKKFREMHSRYRHLAHPWNKFTKIYVDRSRHLVSLEFRWINTDFDIELDGWQYVWCRKQDFDTVVALIRQQIPDIPCVEEKVDVLVF